MNSQTDIHAPDTVEILARSIVGRTKGLVMDLSRSTTAPPINIYDTTLWDSYYKNIHDMCRAVLGEPSRIRAALAELLTEIETGRPPRPILLDADQMGRGLD